jgi:ER membrane protein complex subunit 2
MSLRHFARSVELNDSHLRGYYGLKLVSAALIPLLSDAPTTSKRNGDDDEVQPPKLQSVKKLEELATSKLAEIVRQYSSGKVGWSGFDEAEVIAARELLDRDGKVER